MSFRLLDFFFFVILVKLFIGRSYRVDYGIRFGWKFLGYIDGLDFGLEKERN